MSETAQELAELREKLKVTEESLARVTEELQLARDQFQAVLDAVPGGVSWINADLEYLGINSLSHGSHPAPHRRQGFPSHRNAGPPTTFRYRAPARDTCGGAKLIKHLAGVKRTELTADITTR